MFLFYGTGFVDNDKQNMKPEKLKMLLSNAVFYASG
jgi:hypothetical protein